MSEFVSGVLDPARLLFDLQQGNQIVQRLSGDLSPSAIAQRVTDGLTQSFDCVLARVWLVEPDRQHLKLVASSGLYTGLNGSFSRVPMGAYKVGKIAQNRVSFLSNQLAEESWVRDRAWAIAHQIQGFAGYPLLIRNGTIAGSDEDSPNQRSPNQRAEEAVLGVIATFSQSPMTPEFLEALQFLCTSVAVVLDMALRHQAAPAPATASTIAFHHLPLSDQLASLLPAGRLTLIGKEQPLPLPISYVFLQTAEVLNRLGGQYCRLIYRADGAVLESSIFPWDDPDALDLQRSQFSSLSVLTASLGGELQVQSTPQSKAQQVRLQVPYTQVLPALPVRIHCRLSVLQLAFTQLAQLAGLQICLDAADATVPLITDDATQLSTAKQVIWVRHGPGLPSGVQSQVDLTVTAAELRSAVESTRQDQIWDQTEMDSPLLSDRELEMMTLLSQGLRDRDIANQLFISESTVKFHINNILTKLKARTRYQALHQVMQRGWIA